MNFTIEIPLIGAMFLEVSGEWTPASPLENHEPCDAANITAIDAMQIVARGKIGTGPEREHKSESMDVRALMIMEPDAELNERLIDALEARGGY